MGEGPVRWVHVSVILRWLTREHVLQNAAEIMQKKKKNRYKTNAHASKHGQQKQNAATEKHLNPSNESQKFQIQKRLRRRKKK